MLQNKGRLLQRLLLTANADNILLWEGHGGVTSMAPLPVNWKLPLCGRIEICTSTVWPNKSYAKF